MEGQIIYNKKWEKLNKRPSTTTKQLKQSENNKKYIISLFFLSNFNDDQIFNLLNAIFNETKLNKKDFQVSYYIINNINILQEILIKKRGLESSICILYCKNIIENIQNIKIIEDIIFNYNQFENIPFKIITEESTENFISPHCFLYQNNKLENIIGSDELKILRKDDKLKKRENININNIPSYIKDIIEFKPKFSIFLDETKYQIKLSISFPYYENNNEEQVEIKKIILYTRIFDYYFYLFGERKVNIGNFDYSNIDNGSFGISFSLPFTIFKDIIVLKFKRTKNEHKKKERIYEIIYKKEI